MDVNQAVKVLIASGAVFSVSTGKHLSIAAAAKRLDCSGKWLRSHLAEFPNAWRMPGGEIRIPERDVDALAERKKIRRAA